MTSNFADIIASNYEEIKRNFKSGLRDRGYDWDEDLMNDAFISCNSALKDKPIDKKDAIKYFWTSYINKYKTKKSKEISTESIEDVDIEDVTYDKDIDRIYDIIISELQDRFGIRKAYIWDLYVCQGKSAKAIRSMGFDDIDNFIYFNKQIKRYIKKHIIPSNKELYELIKIRMEK